MNRRAFLLRTGVAAGYGLWGPVGYACPREEPQWDAAATFEADGLKVTLSRPRLVARSSGFLWFPSMHRMADGRLFAILSTYADQAQDTTPAVLTFSADGGWTWSRPVEGVYGEMPVDRPDGSTLLMPYYLRLKSEKLAVGTAYRVAKGSSVVEPVPEPVEVGGWPRNIMLLPADLGGPKAEWKLASFVFNGQAVQAKDGGTLLGTLYGRFAGTRRYSLVLAESADGLKWTIRSVIADETCPLRGGEGPCESALVRLKDGRLLCVYRLDSAVPYGHNLSDDDGKTWSEPKNLDGPFSVQPSLDVSKAGVLLLSGGRPGLFVWVNRAGDASRWGKIDLQAHHNKWVKDEPVTKAQPAFDSNTSSYTEVRWLDDQHFLVMYDRLARGWSAIPKDSKETNSIWVIRGRMD